MFKMNDLNLLYQERPLLDYRRDPCLMEEHLHAHLKTLDRGEQLWHCRVWQVLNWGNDRDLLVISYLSLKRGTDIDYDGGIVEDV